MSHDATSLPPKAPSTPEKKALLDAFDTVIKTQAAEREAELRAAEARRRARNRLGALTWTSLTILGFVGGYLGLTKPEWLFPTESAPESIELRQASLRIGVATAAQHIKRFQQKSGRLPETLAEAGVSGQGITYQRLGPDAYRLEAEEGELRVSLGSNDSLPGFLGNSFELIARRPR
ncbi:MAG TPA: hypothetical protein VH763_09125 [Gemmatimonadales bacterium]|jgi:hypothetical protein